jgi:hypothetical protein
MPRVITSAQERLGQLNRSVKHLQRPTERGDEEHKKAFRCGWKLYD